MPQTTPMLSLNSQKSPELNLLCSILQKQGCLLKPPPVDGDGAVIQFGLRIEDAVIYFQQTHLGPDGKFLPGTGVVDEPTWWALKNPSGDPQKSGLVPTIPTGIDGMRQMVLLAALAEHTKGVCEHPDGSNRGTDIDQYFPDWLQAQLKPGDQGPAWCCFFVNAMVTKAFTGKRPWGLYVGGCSQLYSTVQSGVVHQKGFGNPCTPVLYTDPSMVTPGDVFVILHPKMPLKPQTGHVGFVLRVSKNGTEFNSVEGNCGNRVKVGFRSSDTIAGFINLYGDGGRVEFDRTLIKADDASNDDTR